MGYRHIDSASDYGNEKEVRIVQISRIVFFTTKGMSEPVKLHLFLLILQQQQNSII